MSSIVDDSVMPEFTRIYSYELNKLFCFKLRILLFGIGLPELV